jgi:hypothetical protein
MHFHNNGISKIRLFQQTNRDFKLATLHLTAPSNGDIALRSVNLLQPGSERSAFATSLRFFLAGEIELGKTGAPVGFVTVPQMNLTLDGSIP